MNETQIPIKVTCYIISIILRNANLCFSPGVFPVSCKSAINSHLIKKQGLDSEILIF